MLRLDAYKLKWIAIIGMALHHTVYPWQDIMPLWMMIPLYAVGGLTFPIMGYFVVEGYKYTSNLKGYILRLFVFGLISIPFYMLVMGLFRFNIMFVIIVSLLVLLMYDKIKTRAVFWVIFVLLWIPMFMFFDWLFFGPIVVLLYYTIKNEKARRLAPSFVAGALWLSLSLLSLWGLAQLRQLTELGGDIAIAASAQMDMLYNVFGNTNIIISSVFFIFGCVAGGFLVKNYNGERGKQMKWLFYAFYPIHLAVIGVVALAFGLVDINTLGVF